MTVEGLDLPTIGGGLGILVVMVMVIRLAFTRLDKQDDGWSTLLEAAERRANAAEGVSNDLLEAAERRAVAAETTLAELRQYILTASAQVSETMRENNEKIEALSEELRRARLQIQELQKANGEEP